MASRLPALSIATTEKTCDPTFGFFSVTGLVQAEAAASSSLHSNREPASFEVKVKVAGLPFFSFSFGPDVIVV